MKIIGIIVMFFCYGSTVDAYKILVMHSVPSHSHQAPALALTEELIKKGHTLFVVSPMAIPGLEKNYTHVDVSSAVPLLSDQLSQDSITIRKEVNQWDLIKILLPFASIPTAQFRTQQFQKFYTRVKEENLSFDLVIVESMYLPSMCGMSRLLSGKACAHPPIIALTTLPREFIIEGEIGSIENFSYLPSSATDFSDRMTLLQKMENYVISILAQRFWRRITEQAAEAYFKEIRVTKDLIHGCWSNASLSLIASNSLYSYPRMLSPNVIELGPLHIKPPQKLPKILKDWLDGATKGAIYFSLGTNMKSAHLSETVLSNLLMVFKQLPHGYRILWKWELDGPIPGQPDNILAQKWLPQQSVLAHPNVKAFITQGGLQSFQETVHYGVPTVGIPWAIDQRGSVAKMVHSGVGVKLLPSELESYHKVKTAVEDVLFNESYIKNMRQLSELSRDMTTGSLERAVFWVEHVAKFKGASHLRPSTADSTLFEFFCLDIILVILAIIATILFIFVSALKCLLSFCFSSELKIKTS